MSLALIRECYIISPRHISVALFLLLVRQIRAEFNKNCGFCGKSTKLGTIIVYDMVNNFGCGAHRDLSHNNSERRFLYCPLRTGMETRLALKSLHNSFINMCKTATNLEK